MNVANDFGLILELPERILTSAQNLCLTGILTP
jgi:hypothetical protein